MFRFCALWLYVHLPLRDRRAVTALEYALVGSLIAVAVVTTLTALGTKISGQFTAITNGL